MKIFIEVTSNTDQRPIYDEKTLRYQKTIKVNRPYPYAYGFIFDTISVDGSNLDCYMITTKELKSGTVIEAEPIGMVEYFEDGQEDHKIFMAFPDEQIIIDDKVKQKITEFADHYFDNRPEKVTRMGKFLGKDEAIALIKKCSN